MDRRQLLIAGVIAPLAVLVVVLALVLLRGPSRPPETTVAVRTDERPPGAMASGDGIRPTIVGEAEVPPPEATAGTPAESGPDLDEMDPEGAAPEDGLEAPPRRAPRAAPAPAPVPAPVPAPAPVARPAHEAFARDYLAGTPDSAVSDVLGLYATCVRYYSMGPRDAQTRSTTTRRPTSGASRTVRTRSPRPSASTPSTGTGAATLRFDYDFAVGGGAGGERSGRAWAELDVVPSGGTYLIHGEHGSVTKSRCARSPARAAVASGSRPSPCSPAARSVRDGRRGRRSAAARRPSSTRTRSTGRGRAARRVAARTIRHGYTVLTPDARRRSRSRSPGLFEGPALVGTFVFRYVPPRVGETWDAAASRPATTETRVDVAAVDLDLPDVRTWLDRLCGALPAGRGRARRGPPARPGRP